MLPLPDTYRGSLIRILTTEHRSVRHRVRECHMRGSIVVRGQRFRGLNRHIQCRMAGIVIVAEVHELG